MVKVDENWISLLTCVYWGQILSLWHKSSTISIGRYSEFLWDIVETAEIHRFTFMLDIWKINDTDIFILPFLHAQNFWLSSKNNKYWNVNWIHTFENGDLTNFTSCSMKIFQNRAVVGNTATNDSYKERTSLTCRFWASRNRTDHASTSYGLNSTVCCARTSLSWPHSYIQQTKPTD